MRQFVRKKIEHGSGRAISQILMAQFPSIRWRPSQRSHPAKESRKDSRATPQSMGSAEASARALTGTSRADRLEARSCRQTRRPIGIAVLSASATACDAPMS